MSAVKAGRRSAHSPFWSGVLTGFSAPMEVFISRPLSVDKNFDSVSYAWESTHRALRDAIEQIEAERFEQAQAKALPKGQRHIAGKRQR